MTHEKRVNSNFSRRPEIRLVEVLAQIQRGKWVGIPCGFALFLFFAFKVMSAPTMYERGALLKIGSIPISAATSDTSQPVESADRLVGRLMANEGKAYSKNKNAYLYSAKPVGVLISLIIRGTSDEECQKLLSQLTVSIEKDHRDVFDRVMGKRAELLVVLDRRIESEKKQIELIDRQLKTNLDAGWNTNKFVLMMEKFRHQDRIDQVEIEKINRDSQTEFLFTQTKVVSQSEIFLGPTPAGRVIYLFIAAFAALLLGAGLAFFSGSFNSGRARSIDK